jgi:hypothetical protein
LCIQQSRSYRKAHKIMKWKHRLENAYLKEGIFCALARDRSVVQGSHMERVSARVCVSLIVIRGDNKSLYKSYRQRKKESVGVCVCVCVVECDQVLQYPYIGEIKEERRNIPWLNLIWLFKMNSYHYDYRI